MSKVDKQITELDYEAGMKELEAIAARLEGSQLGLEEMMNLYSRGQELAKHCLELLDQAELKITTLSENRSDDES